MAGYIERRPGGSLCAVVEVPPSLREAVGRKRLRKTLATRDMATAKSRVWAVVAELEGQIEAARRANTGDKAADEARALRKALRGATASEAASLCDHVDDRAHALRGDPIGDLRGVPSSDYEFDPERESRARAMLRSPHAAWRAVLASSSATNLASVAARTRRGRPIRKEGNCPNSSSRKTWRWLIARLFATCWMLGMKPDFTPITKALRASCTGKRGPSLSRPPRLLGLRSRWESASI